MGDMHPALKPELPISLLISGRGPFPAVFGPDTERGRMNLRHESFGHAHAGSPWRALAMAARAALRALGKSIR